MNIQNSVKCFTHFIRPQKIWEDAKIDLDKIRFRVNPNFNWMPPHLLDKYYLALHSTKSIPEFTIGTNFMEVKSQITTTISYSKVDVDSKNQFNCHDYGNNDSLRSDCITGCLMKKLQYEFFDGAALSTHDFLMRMENFDQLDKFVRFRKEKGHMNRNSVSDIKLECINKCIPDCTFSYYLYDVVEGQVIPWSRQTFVYIQHNHIPDVYLVHLPETTFISFISNFGGLLGMWLGVSVIVIFDNFISIFKIIQKYFSKPSNVIIHQPLFINPNFNQYNQQTTINLNRVRS